MKNMQRAMRGMEAFAASQKAGAKVFYGPLFSTVDVLGIALSTSPNTHELPATSLPFFQSGEGQDGQGYSRPLNFAETNLDGSSGQLPAGLSFVALSLGITYFPQWPLHLKDHFEKWAAIAYVRKTLRWNAGAFRLWPMGEYGTSFPAVATTIANQFIEYGLNGRVGAREFPQHGEIYFTEKDQIKFICDVFSPTYATTDGKPWNAIDYGDPGSNALDPIFGLPLQLSMEGWRFEDLNA